jgi:hypothetical protein
MNDHDCVECGTQCEPSACIDTEHMCPTCYDHYFSPLVTVRGREEEAA